MSPRTESPFTPLEAGQARSFLVRGTKILFVGTPEFAIPALGALLEHNYHIVAVLTNPDEPAGRHHLLTPPPVKICAQKHNIPVLQPEKITGNEMFKKTLEELNPDITIVAAYGKILPADIINLPKYKTLNIHPSLLPRWRGPSPIQYTILAGDTQTGVTIIQLDETMDHGPIVAQLNLKSKISNLNYQTLHDELAKLGANLLIEILPKWIRGEIISIPQDDTKATFSKKLKKDDGRIDWKKPAQEIERMVRAFNPWPGTWTMWPHDGKIYRIRIEEAAFTNEEISSGSAGYVVATDSHSLCVKTGHGCLEIKKFTLEGKKPMSAEAFLRGYPAIIGTSLI